jgi:PAS domain-containing protein
LTRKTNHGFRCLKNPRILLIVVLAGAAAPPLLYSRRYSTAVQQHQEELSGISRDLEWNITKRMEVETYYKTLFNVANDAILLSNDLAYVECNQKAVEMFGLPREELLTMTILDCSPELQPDGSRSDEKTDNHPPGFPQRQSRMSSAGPLSAKAASNSRPRSATSFRLKNRDLVLSSIRDISKRVDAEMQLMQAQKMPPSAKCLGPSPTNGGSLNTLSTYIQPPGGYYNSMLSKEVVERWWPGRRSNRLYVEDHRRFPQFLQTLETQGPVDILRRSSAPSNSGGADAS